MAVLDFERMNLNFLERLTARRRRVAPAFDATELLLGFDDRSTDPTDNHRAALPTLDVSRVGDDPAVQVLDSIRRAELLVEKTAETQPLKRERVRLLVGPRSLTPMLPVPTCSPYLSLAGESGRPWGRWRYLPSGGAEESFPLRNDVVARGSLCVLRAPRPSESS